MKAVPITDERFNTYASWWKARDLNVPIPGARAIFLEHEGVLVSGMMLYSTDGPFTFFEHFAVSPTATPTLAHRAGSMTLAIAEGLCAMEGKQPFVLAGKKGIVNLLERTGYARQPDLFVFSK